MSRLNTPPKSSLQAKVPKNSHVQQPPPRDNLDAGVQIDDPYILNTQYAEMAQCSQCDVVHHQNRWYLPKDLSASLNFQPGKGPSAVCPACRKINDMYALGVVEVRGSFAQKHKEEIQGLARGVEQRRRERNPLERIMKFGEQEQGFDILTTDERLASQIARTLQRSYEGEVSYDFDGANQKFLRVTWNRDTLSRAELEQK